MAIEIRKVTEDDLPGFCDMVSDQNKAHKDEYLIEFERNYLCLCYEHVKELHQVLGDFIKREEW